LISVCTRIGFSSLARSIAIASFQSSGLNFSGSGFQEAVSVRHGALLFEAADLEGRGNAREEVQVLADGCAAAAPGGGHLPPASPRHPDSLRCGNREQSQPQDERVSSLIILLLFSFVHCMQEVSLAVQWQV